MKKLKKKLIIFDADGTIWDSEKDVFLAFNHTLKTNMNKEITKEEFQTLAGLPLGDMFKHVLPEDKKELLQKAETNKQDIKDTLKHELTHAAYTIKGKYGIGETHVFNEMRKKYFWRQIL